MLHSPPLASNLVIPLYLSVHENGQWNLEKKKERASFSPGSPASPPTAFPPFRARPVTARGCVHSIALRRPCTGPATGRPCSHPPPAALARRPPRLAQHDRSQPVARGAWPIRLSRGRTVLFVSSSPTSRPQNFRCQHPPTAFSGFHFQAPPTKPNSIRRAQELLVRKGQRVPPWPPFSTNSACRRRQLTGDR